MIARLLPRCALSWTYQCSSSSLHSVFLNARLFSNADRTKRVDVQLNESELTESFVKGSGKGGQKINKVQCQKTRSLDGNRRAARKLLQQKLDDHINGALSMRSLKIDKLRRKKASRKAKSRQKYAKMIKREDDDEGSELESESDELEDSEDDMKSSHS
ncbi:Mitochondrial polypeptide chain release factor [Plasmopara halstedii]|uniref:Mitochondrial polypeptide chain release factor n=1 Tax=Plasmopara halstedii TaxID=4781 RepID=A0A0P1AS50_PLAHL|nr:Mitochondrial polypeptide chain release factor [Plasmopara halstedii]CEG44433.1 Mitochondrial polypeptide chain release factor [Plasmopara halstedii]|eukprot:XP_024580802.1 Mitochondrial polypeptide chain release factor [Plasmopara halstedii]